jgi:hypothetical protein
MKKPIYIVDDFYDNPDDVREYALKCEYYQPFVGSSLPTHDDAIVESPSWLSSISYQRYITKENISKLEKIIGTEIDIDNFYSDLNPTNNYSPNDNGTKFNAGFQVKLESEDPSGDKGIHAHIGDGWNHCDEHIGWAAVVFLTPNNISEKNAGFDVWESEHNYPWITTNNTINNQNIKIESKWDPTKQRNIRRGFTSDRVECPDYNPCPVEADGWDMTSRVQFKYNTLVLHACDRYHAGGNGWGDSIENGRMIQTFFFKEKV